MALQGVASLQGAAKPAADGDEELDDDLEPDPNWDPQQAALRLTGANIQHEMETALPEAELAGTPATRIWVAVYNYSSLPIT